MSTYLIVDLEATCWQKGTSPRRMETIEIGAVKLDGGSMRENGEFQTFVRPRDEPDLSDFCRELTSIEQSDVDGAPAFPEALYEFVGWVGDAPVVFCSWGDYDHSQIENDCRRHRLSFPSMLERHINLKKVFVELQGIKPCGMKRALGLLGIDAQGAHHRALDDARNIAKIARFVLPRLALWLLAGGMVAGVSSGASAAEATVADSVAGRMDDAARSLTEEVAEFGASEDLLEQLELEARTLPAGPARIVSGWAARVRYSLGLTEWQAESEGIMRGRIPELSGIGGVLWEFELESGLIDTVFISPTTVIRAEDRVWTPGGLGHCFHITDSLTLYPHDSDSGRSTGCALNQGDRVRLYLSASGHVALIEVLTEHRDTLEESPMGSETEAPGTATPVEGNVIEN